EGDARRRVARTRRFAGRASTHRRGQPGVRRARPRSIGRRRTAARPLRWPAVRLGEELKARARHSAIYALGGLVSRILAPLLLPLYTHYLPPRSYGRVEILTATTA